MKRYDVAILGAGPDGLIAAQRLALAGLDVVVLERRATTGGRAATREFHPGFLASPYTDELPSLATSLSWRLDPGRRGTTLMPASASVCLSAAGPSVLYADKPRMARAAGPSAPGLVTLMAELAETRAAIANCAQEQTTAPRKSWFSRVHPRRRPWPGEEWGRESLASALASRIASEPIALHLAASALSGRAASPFFAGTALHLLGVGGDCGLAAGNLSTFAAAIDARAREAGAEIRCEADATDIEIVKGRAGAVVLSNGETIAVRAVLSTLDLKRTFLSLVAWNSLPSDLARRIAQFRVAGTRARILFALDSIPKFEFASDSPEAALGPIYLVESMTAFSRVYDSWRAGVLLQELPVTLRFPSLSDPRLAPPGKAVMTATLGSVPARLFDGGWTMHKRGELVKIAILAAERASPGIANRIIAAETIVGGDFERELGLTGGDLDGGEIAPDQALGFRPFPEWQGGRTPLRGLYLAGPSASPSPFLLGAAGEHAAGNLLADISAGHLT